MNNHTTPAAQTFDEQALDVLALLDADAEARLIRGEPRHGVVWQRAEAEPLRMLLPRGLRAEILIQPTINRLPGAPNWLLGLVNARGELIPVIDLPLWAGLARSTEKMQRVLHLGAGEQSFALLVDAEPRLLFTQPTNTSVQSALPDALQGFVEHTVLSDGVVWFDLNYGAWLSSFTRGR
jgi:chemotaxis signal transduction protein